MQVSTNDATAQMILDHASDLVVQGGLAALTTDALATRAGVSKATIYRRWRHRSHILRAVMERLITKVDVPDHGSFREDVRFLLEHRLKQYQAPGTAELLASLVGASAEDEEIAVAFHDWIAYQKAGNIALIERAIARGELPPSLSPDDLSSIIAGPMLFRVAFERRTPDPAFVQSLLAVLDSLSTAPQARTARESSMG